MNGREWGGIRFFLVALALMPGGLLSGVAWSQPDKAPAPLPLPPIHSAPPPGADKLGQRTVQPDRESLAFMPTPIKLSEPVKGGAVDGAGERLWPPPSIEYSLSWTRFEAFRVSDEPVEAVLIGTISTSNPIIWSFTDAMANGAPPDELHFVEGVTGGKQGSPIPLELTYSLDGGQWLPMPVDGPALCVPVPSGVHELSIRFYGIPPAFVAAGFYQLLLEHEMTPQL